MTVTKGAKTMQAAQRGWVILDDGYEVTQSSEIINDTLRWLKTKNIPLILVQEGYQSAHCRLIETNDNHIQLDRPLDWPGASKTVRVVFKGVTKLWHHFYIKIFEEAGGILNGTSPATLYKLQRRNHFRVRVPINSKASFVYEGVAYKNLAVHDLSAGGAKLFTQMKLRLPEHVLINEIQFEVYAGSDNSRRFDIICHKGRIIRSITDKRTEGSILAIQFFPDSNEEEAIIKYVRQREIDLLRRGVTSQFSD